MDPIERANFESIKPALKYHMPETKEEKVAKIVEKSESTEEVERKVDFPPVSAENVQIDRNTEAEYSQELYSSEREASEESTEQGDKDSESEEYVSRFDQYAWCMEYL